MRVISQWRDVDVDYESNSFAIIENKLENSTDQCCITCFSNGQQLIMATYSTFEKAKKALTMMSEIYVRYLITDNNGYMTMTEGIECKLDKPFNKIEVKRIKTTVYRFPQEDDVYE